MEYLRHHSISSWQKGFAIGLVVDILLGFHFAFFYTIFGVLAGLLLEVFRSGSFRFWRMFALFILFLLLVSNLIGPMLASRDSRMSPTALSGTIYFLYVLAGLFSNPYVLLPMIAILAALHYLHRQK